MEEKMGMTLQNALNVVNVEKRSNSQPNLKGLLFMPSQKDYDLKWANNNRDHRRYLSRRSSARTFIRRYASEQDLKDLQSLIRERKNELTRPITLGSDTTVVEAIQDVVDNLSVPTELGNLKTFYDFLIVHLKQDGDFAAYIHDFINHSTEQTNNGSYQLAPFQTKSGLAETIHYSHDLKQDVHHYIFKEDWKNGNDR